MRRTLASFASFALVAALVVAACGTVRPTPPRPAPSDAYSNYVSAPPADLEGLLPDIQPVYIDVRFTDAERASIVAAVREWNVALNGYRVYDVQVEPFDMDLGIIKRMMDTTQGLLVLRADVEGLDPDLETALAWVPGLGAPLVHVVSERIGTRDLRTIVMHEIGHTLGLPHVPVKGTLMFPYYPFGVDCIDRITAQALATIRRLDWHHLRFCERPS